ncbi:MAG: type II secretion system F family protein [Planctomycetes bacterium]|nr:type II secretion system F family protein [Planctomycetota bacterium]
MPIFEYKAISPEGKSISDTIDADSGKEAREILRYKRLMVTSIYEIDAAGTKVEKGKPRDDGESGLKIVRGKVQFKLPKIGGRVKGSDIANFTRQLSTLLKSGIPIANSLNILIEQIESKSLAIVLRDVRERITQGASFSEALDKHKRAFTTLYVNMVRAGEAAGNLDEILDKLAKYIQSQNRIKGKIGAAMTYPVVLAIIAILVVIFLMTFVVPRMTMIFKRNADALPWITKFVVGTSDFIAGNWLFLILALIGIWVTIYSLMQTNKGRYFYDTALLKIPALGDLMKKSYISRFCVTLSTLLRSGLPALDALKIVKTVIGNKVLEDTIIEVHDKILEGADISGPLKKSGVFPPAVGYMIAVGEQAGSLEEILDKIAESYDEELDLAIQKFTSMLEPLLIVFMAFVVGGIVASILIPLLQMANAVNR